MAQTIETRYYAARIDPQTGALVSLKLKPSGREVLGGPANVVVAETADGLASPADVMVGASGRRRQATSSDFAPRVTVRRGSLATTVELLSGFYGGSRLRRLIRMYHEQPRIDFETELEKVPDGTIVTAEFPLADDIRMNRRGIPYGFSEWKDRRQLPRDAYLDYYQVALKDADAILPAVQWSDHELVTGDGVAVLDRGLPGREVNGRTVSLHLLNSVSDYRGLSNAWLSGKPPQSFSYAVVAHEGDWRRARIAPLAWEFNSPPLVVDHAAAPAPERSWLSTSENLILEALRREEGFVELRLTEWKGLTGTAEVDIAIPHRDASLTNLVGENVAALGGTGKYHFDVMPQQIVTLRLHTDSLLEPVTVVRSWDELVPRPKRRYSKTRFLDKGHPPEIRPKARNTVTRISHSEGARPAQ